MVDCTFYVVGDRPFFLGVVALVNSLRLVGHEEPIVVLDCGFDEWQRELLAREAIVVPAPDASHPAFLKWQAPLARPSDVMVLVDADMIIVRSLAPLLDLAAPGKTVAFVDLNPDRFDPGWAEMVGLETLPRRTYVNSGLVVLSEPDGRELLQLLHEIQPTLPLDLVRDDGTKPFKYRDQDVLNLVLAVHRRKDDLVVLERRLAPCPPFYALRVVDERTLECRFRDGVQPYLLHHITDKPWLRPTPPTPYSQLLPRLLLAEDLPIRLTPADLPVQLRPGVVGGGLRGLLLLRWLATKTRFKLRLLLGIGQNRPVAHQPAGELSAKTGPG
jgi:hypothetical protein